MATQTFEEPATDVISSGVDEVLALGAGQTVTWQDSSTTVSKSVLLFGPPEARTSVTGLLDALGYEVAIEVDDLDTALKELKRRTIDVVLIAERRRLQASYVAARINACLPCVHVALMPQIDLSKKSVRSSPALSRAEKSSISHLTSREQEIYQLLKSRLTNREISETLQLSQWTVKSHVSNILKKLHIGSRREISEY